MRVQFDGAVPHSITSTVLRFLIFLPVHVRCSCLLFFCISICDPRCSTRLRRRWRREGGNGGTQARRARYTSTGWGSSGGKRGCSLGKDWLHSLTDCSTVYGSSYLSILLLPPPLECGGISIILVGNLVWLSSYPLPSPAVSWGRGSKGSIQGTVGAQS